MNPFSILLKGQSHQILYFHCKWLTFQCHECSAREYFAACYINCTVDIHKPNQKPCHPIFGTFSFASIKWQGIRYFSKFAMLKGPVKKFLKFRPITSVSQATAPWSRNIPTLRRWACGARYPECTCTVLFNSVGYFKACNIKLGLVNQELIGDRVANKD